MYGVTDHSLSCCFSWILCIITADVNLSRRRTPYVRYNPSNVPKDRRCLICVPFAPSITKTKVKWQSIIDCRIVHTCRNRCTGLQYNERKKNSNGYISNISSWSKILLPVPGDVGMSVVNIIYKNNIFRKITMTKISFLELTTTYDCWLRSWKLYISSFTNTFLYNAMFGSRGHSW